jgi:two-component system OmpR family sensor kinase
MMSIRLRLTLLYTAILAVTLIVFGATLYVVQAQYTLNSLKRDLSGSSDRVSQGILRTYLDPSAPPPRPELPPPLPFEKLSGEQAFKDLREREIVRVLNEDGTLVSSPFSGEDALPLSETGLQALHQGKVWWDIVTQTEERMLVYNNPLFAGGELVFIVQVARPLTERDRSLATLETTLIAAGLLTILIAFGIGWAFAGVTLRPIHRITQTAQTIGSESDFTRRVDYCGPNDEIGHLATTFNSMLSRLQDAYQRVSQALKLQRNFVADVSHELRTPLTTIRGNLALLSRNPPLSGEEQTDVLADLEDESDRLIRLVNDLLVLARADARRSLSLEPVPVKPVIEEACRQARLLDRRRVIVDSVEEDVIVRGDRDTLKQVLMILLDNALKHSQGTIGVESESVGDETAISVIDEGPGMDSEILEHAFDRFYRGEVGANTPGFGLGLPIAKALVEGMGGRIAIESVLGKGSKVTIALFRIE